MIHLKALSKRTHFTRDEIVKAFHDDMDFLNMSVVYRGTYANKSDILQYTKESIVILIYGTNYQHRTSVTLERDDKRSIL